MNCPLCERGHDESREQAARRVESMLLSKPNDANKRRARLGRACFEPLSERASKISHLSEANRGRRDEGDMDMSYFGGLRLDDPEPFLDPVERALRMARNGTRVAPPTPWWILENAR